MNAISLENRDQKTRFLDEAQKKNAAGTATDYDVLVAKVGLENAKPVIVRTENHLLSLRERLRFLLGRDGRPVDVRGDLATEIAPYPEYGRPWRPLWRTARSCRTSATGSGSRKSW